MKIPTKELAEEFLIEAGNLNPGKWESHSRFAAQAAMLIAERCEGLDKDAAYVLGLLHDIGRRDGIFHLKHVIQGYKFLKEKGFDDAARVCLTHSFIIKKLETYVGEHDCSAHELEFLRNFLDNIEYNDYDRLIQLCDFLALPEGLTFIEKRMVDVTLRYGFNDLTITKWNEVFKIKEYFDEKIGCSIYSLFPKVIL